MFFFKQKTAYEMRISDWSSDVCSSDLQTGRLDDDVGTDFVPFQIGGIAFLRQADLLAIDQQRATFNGDLALEIAVHGVVLEHVREVVQIGRASCRERVCQYV